MCDYEKDSKIKTRECNISTSGEELNENIYINL